MFSCSPSNPSIVVTLIQFLNDIQPFESNHKGDVASGENEFDTSAQEGHWGKVEEGKEIRRETLRHEKKTAMRAVWGICQAVLGQITATWSKTIS